MKVKQKFLLTIEVDSETITHKYPNYKCFKNTEEFIDFIANDLEWVGDINMSKEGMDEYGYSIKINTIKSK